MRHFSNGRMLTWRILGSLLLIGLSSWCCLASVGAVVERAVLGRVSQHGGWREGVGPGTGHEHPWEQRYGGMPPGPTLDAAGRLNARKRRLGGDHDAVPGRFRPL